MSCLHSSIASLRRRLFRGLMIGSVMMIGCGYQWSGHPQADPSGPAPLRRASQPHGASGGSLKSRLPQGAQTYKNTPISIQNLTLVSGLEWVVQEGLGHAGCSRITSIKLQRPHPSLPIGFAGQSRVSVHILSARVIYIGETGEQALTFRAPLMSAYTAIGAPLPTSRASWVEATTRLTAQMSSLCSTGHP